MGIVFAHDHIFYKTKNQFFSNGSFPKKVLERYTKVFGELTVLSRQKQIDDTISNQFSLSSSENIEFIEVPNFRSIKKVHLRLKATKMIEKEISTADFLIARVPSSIGQLAIKYAQKYKIPYVVEVVGCAWDSHYNYGSLTGKIIAPLAYLQQKNAVKDSPYTIYITEEFLQRRYPSKGKIEVCPNVNIEYTNDEILQKRFEKIDINNNYFTFGLVGSLNVNYKGHETTIKALNILKNKYKINNFKIEFVGKGKKDKWEKMAYRYNLIENIEFKGGIPNKEMNNWYDHIDISIQPSSAEAQGRSIIEAMSRGCTVISSQVGGVPELINHELLIEPDNYVKLANILKKLMSNKQVLKDNSLINFNKAKQFKRDDIEYKREKFLKGISI